MSWNNKRRECNRCAIGIILVCTTVFVSGCVLLGLGFMFYKSEPPPPPYFWSLTLCPGLEKETWIGVSLDKDSDCSKFNLSILNDPEEGIPQSFTIPSTILREGIPYEPVFYVTNNVLGSLTISHKVAGDIIFTHSSSLSNLIREDFAYAGGKSLNIYRDGPLTEEEGDYITEDCQNLETGCVYEPARSLNSFTFLEANVHMPKIPEDGSTVTISVSLEANKTSAIILPEVYLQYRVNGLGKEERMGLALIIVGAIFADLMPATLYFLLQKYYYEKKSEDDTKGMIPLMEMQ